MNSIRRVIATSLTFHQTIPKLWAVKDAIRVLENLSEDEDFKSMPLDKQVVEVIVTLLDDNPSVSFRQVYGITAVILMIKDMFSESESMVCTIIKNNSSSANPLPDVLSNNHRYFVWKDRIIDPIKEHYTRRGNVMYTKDVYRINSISPTVLHGLIGRASNSHFNARSWDEGTPAATSWFSKAVHKISRRMNLTPYWWSRKDRKGIKDKMGFEGYMRELVPRFMEEDEEWKTFLKAALSAEFSKWPSSSIDNFILRISKDFGPMPPKTQYIQRKKVRMVDPDTQHINPSGYI